MKRHSILILKEPFYQKQSPDLMQLLSIKSLYESSIYIYVYTVCVYFILSDGSLNILYCFTSVFCSFNHTAEIVCSVCSFWFVLLSKVLLTRLKSELSKRWLKETMTESNFSSPECFSLPGFPDQLQLHSARLLATSVIDIVTLTENTMIILVTFLNSKLHTPMYFPNFSFIDLCFMTSVVPQIV